MTNSKNLGRDGLIRTIVRRVEAFVFFLFLNRQRATSDHPPHSSIQVLSYGNRRSSGNSFRKGARVICDNERCSRVHLKSVKYKVMQSRFWCRTCENERNTISEVRRGSALAEHWFLWYLKLRWTAVHRSSRWLRTLYLLARSDHSAENAQKKLTKPSLVTKNFKLLG